LHSGRMSIAEIDNITGNEDLFYKNLVRLKLQGDSLGGATYTEELQYRGVKQYVSKINELHNSPDGVRFNGLDGMSPEELYCLLVSEQGHHYPPPLAGIFNRMMERLKPATGDELFNQVRYEHFPTFIRMGAGHSKLTEFPGTMTQ